jgi:hypothetical protein
MFLPLCQWGLLVVKCWNSNITTGVNYSNLYLSFINFKQTWYVICSSRKLSFGWCWLCSCTEENSAFRGEDLEAVASKPIRNTLWFARLRWESETEDGNCRLKRNDLDSERSLLLQSSLPNEITEINFVLSPSQQELHTRSDKWDNLFITTATAKHTLMLMWSHDFPHNLKFETGFLLKFILISLFRF